MSAKNKKAVSPIVATLFIILLAIVVFAIISVVVRNTVGKGAENIELSAKCLEVDLKATQVVNSAPSQYDVTLDRSGSGESIDGATLIFSDGSTSESKKIVAPINPLDKFTQTFVITTPSLVPTEVTVVPFFLKKDGTEYLCETANTFNF